MATIPKRYMLILQKTHGGQEALEFYDTAIGPRATLALIEPFTDQKKFPSNKSDKTVKKNTLAFFDSITCQFKNFDLFLSVVGQQPLNGKDFIPMTIFPFDYKPTGSYIGFLSSNHIETLPLYFNDKVLANIASSCNGNNINTSDSATIYAVTQLVELIEDSECDFVSKLSKCYESKNRSFNFQPSFVELIKSYHNLNQLVNSRNNYSCLVNDALTEDFVTTKAEFIDKLRSYRNFRELYRFYKYYQYQKAEEAFMEMRQAESKRNLDDFDRFKAQYEEVRQKSYSLRKKKESSNDQTTQYSLFEE